jgi:hypothetical protein
MTDLKKMTVAEGELRVALDQLARVVDVMKRADPEFCDSHGVEQCDDEEWDEVLAEAEEYLDEMRIPSAPPA